MSAANVPPDLPDWLNGLTPQDRDDLLGVLSEYQIDLGKINSLSESERAEWLAECLAAANDLQSADDYDYQKQKEYAAQRSRERSKAGRDIGELPRVANPEQREACRQSLRLFLETYFPKAFRLGWCEDHLVLIDEIERVILNGGFRAVGMPRGTGKTTILARALLWAICAGVHSFVSIVAANSDKAEKILRDISTELQNNRLLMADFPEVGYPFIMLEGQAGRARGQLFRGKLTNIQTSDKTICCACLDGYPGTGAILSCAGIQEAVRGANHTFPDGRVIRPSLMLVDDFQTRESANSAKQCHERIEIIQNDLIGMAGPDAPFSAFVTCTVIRRDDAADRLLNPELHPDFVGIRRRFLKSLPSESAMVLWHEYSDLRARSLRQYGDLRDATAYYQANRAAMDDGAEASWPARYVERKGEVSAIQHAMEWYYRSRTGFWSELQNEPEGGDSVVRVWATASDLIESRNEEIDRGVIPGGYEKLVGNVDVQGSLLYWSVQALRSDGSAHLVQYGTWPEQDVSFFTLKDATKTLARKYPKRGPVAALSQGLSDLWDWLFEENRFVNEDGESIDLDWVGTDARWQTAVVKQAIQRSQHRKRLIAYFGQSFRAADKPIADRKYDAGSKVGVGWVMPKRKSVKDPRTLTADVNFWKTELHDRLAIRIGLPGALTFHRGVHRLLAEHLTGEFSTQTEGRGRTVHEWRLRPGSENHWLDTMVAGLVLGSVLGCNVSEQSESVERKKRRRTRRKTSVVM